MDPPSCTQGGGAPHSYRWAGLAPVVPLQVPRSLAHAVRASAAPSPVGLQGGGGGRDHSGRERGGGLPREGGNCGQYVQGAISASALWRRLLPTASTVHCPPAQ